MWVRIVVAACVAWGSAGLAYAEAAEPTGDEQTGAATMAPEATPPSTSAVPTPPPPDVIPLSLHEAISLGIENNTDVQLIRYDPPISEYDYEAAWGAHDPTLFADYFYHGRNTPTASVLLREDPTLPPTQTFQLDEREQTGSAGLFGLVPRLGWSYDLSYTGSELNTNSPIESLTPSYRSGLTVSATAPLLRGAWWGAAWTQVELADVGTGVALDEFRERLMNIVGGFPGVPIEQNLGIENAYWTLAARKQDREVAQKSLETARELLRQTKAQYDVGVVSRVEVTEAEAGVANREFTLITAENRYRNAQDELIDRVYGPRLTATSHVEIDPTDRPENYVTFSLDPERSMQRALERRPELAVARQRVDQREITLKYAKNERLPQLDLVGSYGTLGIAGDPNQNTLFGDPLPPGLVPTGYSGTDDFWFKGNDNRVYTGGARLSIPIPNTTARSRVGIAELELHRAETSVRRTEQDIVKEVRDAVRNLRSALEGIEAAERSVAAFAEQLRAERIRLEHGESTPFDVLLREEDLVEAESRRIAALRVYHGSVTALDRAQGTLLEDRGILLEDALPLR